MTYSAENMCNKSTFSLIEDPIDLAGAKIIIADLRNKHRTQSEQIMAWRKLVNMQQQQHYRETRYKTEQYDNLTGQLLLLESRLKRKQKQIANILCQRELTIFRQQKLIDALSSRLVDHGLDTSDSFMSYGDFDSINDSDSAVILEDIDSDCNLSFVMRNNKGSGGGGGGGGGVVRSISDTIDSNLKFSGNCAGVGNRRSNCFLRRPDILETVYSVEEDPEPDITEKRDKFKNRTQKISIDDSITSATAAAAAATAASATLGDTTATTMNDLINKQPFKQFVVGCLEQRSLVYEDRTIDDMNNIFNRNNDKNISTIGDDRSDGCVIGKGKQITQVTNYNRVMSNHRSVTKPKDVKYRRINKAKSKSLEELRGRLKHWVEKSGGTIDSVDAIQKRSHSYA